MSNEMQSINDEQQVLAQCRKCGASQPDHDGFGVLLCNSCGYCRHPSSTRDLDGDYICDLCGQERVGNTVIRI